MSKFYELSTDRRVKQLAAAGYLSDFDLNLLGDNPILPTAIASHLIENHIGIMTVPLGLATSFLIDQQPYVVPLATEEPSVIAAASNAAKRIQASGGFQTQIMRHGLTAQIVFEGIIDHPQDFLAQHHAKIEQIAQKARPSLIKRGGGLRQVSVKQVGSYLEFDLLIDTRAAMGANTVNTIAEAVGAYLQLQLPDLKLLMAILSNDTPHQRAQVSAAVDFNQLATDTIDGEAVAQKIVAASKFAQISPQRAATQNKGIMNSIEAVVLATGNDTRNVNAAAYSALSAEKKTWTDWQIVGRQLVGTIDIPMPIGVVGGAISNLPLAQVNLKILNNPSAEKLMGIIAAVGLASNLAAVRAIVTQGIQAGHMNLQMQSLALMAGAKPDELELLTDMLRQQISPDLELAQQLLETLRQKQENE